MRLIVDAMSVNNLSGAHVLCGHIDQVARRSRRLESIVVVTHRDNASLMSSMPKGAVHLCADANAKWWSRAGWSLLHFERKSARFRPTVLLNPAGMTTPGARIPQVVLAQNPLPLVSRAAGLAGWRLGVQRLGFARAHKSAACMIFNSRFMLNLYTRSFGPPASPPVVAYQGLGESRIEAASTRLPVGERRADVLCVSVMARHKRIELLVDAFAGIAQGGGESRLIIAGGWPDPDYRQAIEARVAALRLSERVSILGHVSEPTLDSLYRSSRVFCLLSECESFGIPAAEAQLFGTPCVVAEGTAAPEIVGDGGIIVPAGDAVAASRAIASLLTDPDLWEQVSRAAVENTQRFRWATCSEPLVSALEACDSESSESRRRP